MFTGLIEETGKIKSVNPLGGGKRLTIAADKIMGDLKIDDSVSINGVCQTVVSRGVSEFTVEAVEETLRKSTLGDFRPGSEANLERALRLGDRMGGHIVQGHVDAVGNIQSIAPERAAVNVWASFPPEFEKYVVTAGSVCVDGISLTTARVEGSKFMIAVIPHTWKNTTLRNRKPGDKINLEFDILGKYIEKLTMGQSAESNTGKSGSILDQYIDQPGY